MKKFDTIFLFVKYYAPDLDVFRTFQEMFPGEARRKALWIVVDNHRPGEWEERIDDSTHVIGGDNALQDFSGWDRGLKYVLRCGFEADLIVIANETCVDATPELTQYLGPDAFRLAKSHNLALGVIYYLPDINQKILRYMFDRKARYSIDGQDFLYWIRSHFLIAPFSAIKQKGTVSTYDSSELFFPETLTADVFRPQAPCSTAFRQRLIDWLAPEQQRSTSRHWHSSFRLTDAAYDRFKSKSLAIINEKCLSIWLRRNGVILFNLIKIDRLKMWERRMPRFIVSGMLRMYQYAPARVLPRSIALNIKGLFRARTY